MVPSESTLDSRFLTPIADRFWPKVGKGKIIDCWLWKGRRDRSGYGQITVLGVPYTRSERAHRISWLLHFGYIPEGIHVLHHCDNPPCVRPDHLYLGTAADNAADMVAKGRQGKRRKPSTPA